jgi:hypothetical protein
MTSLLPLQHSKSTAGTYIPCLENSKGTEYAWNQQKAYYVNSPEVALLGRRVDALGMPTPTERLKAITSLQFPDTLQKLETYNDMIGGLRHLVPRYA